MKGTSIYSWIGTLHPKGIEKSPPPITALPRLEIDALLLALCTSTYALVQALSALLLEILNLNLLNSELIEVP
jgi:hypothetical protein